MEFAGGAAVEVVRVPDGAPRVLKDFWRVGQELVWMLVIRSARGSLRFCKVFVCDSLSVCL